MLDALRSLMAPPALVVLGGVVGAVAAFARLFRRPGSKLTGARGKLTAPFAAGIGRRHPEPFEAFLRSLDDDRDDDART